jgi:hypothetical protein
MQPDRKRESFQKRDTSVSLGFLLEKSRAPSHFCARAHALSPLHRDPHGASLASCACMRSAGAPPVLENAPRCDAPPRRPRPEAAPYVVRAREC